jgi:uncharacterized protein (DUF2141 family)
MMLAQLLVFAWILQSPSIPPQPASEDVIHVDVEGLRSDRGQVICALYSSADGFPKDANKVRMRTQSAASSRRGVCDFTGLQPGTYAVALFHDENSNGKLDANFMGVPREGTGASNNAKGHLGPPKFDDSAFRFSGGRLELKITVNYY